MNKLIIEYINRWKFRGYPNDIPDEVPEKLAQLNLAPSYKAICIAILKNDHSMQGLGFSPKKSIWYNELKRIEIEGRDEKIQQRKKRVRSKQRALPLYF